MFTFVTVTILAIVVVFLLFPLFSKRNNTTSVERSSVNLQSAKIRLIELQQELENEAITEDEFQRYRLEIEKATVDDLRNIETNEAESRKGNILLAIIITLSIPGFSYTFYKKLGHDPDSFIETGFTNESVIASQNVEKMLVTVEKELQNNPEEIEVRIALAQVYIELERFSDAARVYKELYQLRPDDPDVIVNYAEALARSHGNRLTGRPIELLNEALKLDSNHGRALWLAGFAEQQAGNKDAAIAHWKHLLAGIETDSEVYQHIENLISETEIDGSDPTAVAATQTDTVKQSIKVNVSLSPELQTKINPNTTMFIFARAAEGPPMPLAVHRGLAKDLPVSVTLDDSMAMMPQMTLSRFPKIIVGARLSSNGQPQGQSGDYEGFSDSIEISSNPVVDILINAIKP